MSDKPIIFSAPMIRALLDDRKSQTRRVLKPQPPADMGLVGIYAPKLTAVFGYETLDADHSVTLRYMPKGRLWVKEAWRTFASQNNVKPSELWHPDCGHGTGIMYESDQYGLAITKDGERFDGPRDDPNAFGKLRSPMFMPRWASRITLIITDVRVQRLQEISEQDALREGMDYDAFLSGDAKGKDAASSFRILWDSINAFRGFGWDVNPWVAAYAFEVVKANIDTLEAA